MQEITSNFRMLDMLHMLTVGLNGSLLSRTPKLHMCNPYNGAESESVGFFNIAKTPEFHFLIGFHAHGDGWCACEEECSLCPLLYC